MRNSAEMSPLSRYRHGIVHHPVVEGVEVPPVPYLTLPFAQESLIQSVRACGDRSFSSRRLYDVTEGSFYTKAETRIHGIRVHGGVDYHAPYGTPIVAPCDGFVLPASYHSFPLTDERDRPRMLDGKELYFGLGYFVQIYNPEVNRFVVLGHLSDIAKGISFSPPIFDEGSWNPTNHTLKIEELKDHPAVVSVKQGDEVGRLGFSGLRYGYEDYYAGEKRPVQIDPTKQVSYDEPHVHFEEYFRDQTNGRKGWQRDPYDIYLTARNYPTPTRRRPMGPEPLFHIGKDGLPVFAR
jgi:murein DD-endopeptidase MepM/ murein hydrolase activator NlpD